jgi:nucleoside-diphosphate-sugar epimerase
MMPTEHKPSVTEIAVRVIADAIMVNVALALAILVRYIMELKLNDQAGPLADLLSQLVGDYLSSFWLLTAIAMVVFAVSGFYTHGRYYQGRYKALVVAQAVSLTYLIFGSAAFLSHGAISPPRTVLFGGWLLTCTFLIMARLWTMLWRMIDMRPVVQRVVPKPSVASKRRTLVIGGAGYIGSALLPKLLQRGHHVRLLDLFLFGKEPIAGVLGHPNLEVVHADFRHVDKIVRAMTDADEVVHLGAIVGDPACSLDRELTVEVNLMATRMIAEVAKGCGIRRFYFASTCSVYGASDQFLDERSELNPISLYAQSKLASETVLMQLAGESFAPVVLRFGTVYGLSGRTRFDLVVNLLTAKAVTEKKITVYGGEQWRPFLHVDDAASAIIKAIEAPTDLIHGQVFNVGSNEQNYRLKEAAALIQTVVPNSHIVDMGADSDFRNYRVDFGKIRKMLGYTAQWSLRDGVMQVVAALEGGEVVDYRRALYSNVKFLSEETNTRLIRSENGWAEQLIKVERPYPGQSIPAVAR